MPSSNPCENDAKPALRAAQKIRWRAVSAGTAAAESRAVCAALASAVSAWNPVLVFAFQPLPDEPDIRELWGGSTSSAPRFAFPKTRPATRALDWFEPTGHPAMAGALGVMEPDPATWRPVAADARPDLVLVPGLAFDPARGTRLGRGLGYYDRFLATLDPASTRVVGMACSWHLVADIPADHLDIPVPWLITPAAGLTPTAALSS